MTAPADHMADRHPADRGRVDREPDRDPGEAAGPSRAQRLAGRRPAADRPVGVRGGPITVGIAALLAVALLGPLLFLLVHGWRSAGAEQQADRDRRAGIEYLRPLTRLAGALTDGWVSAAGGRVPDQQAVRAAVSATDAVDAEAGDRLGVHAAWTDLRQRVLAARTSPAPADAADLVDRTVRLVADVGAAAGLLLDPEPADRNLADAAVVRVPALLAAAGRLAALSAAEPPASGPAATAAAATRAVASDRVGRAAVELDDALRRGAAEPVAGTPSPSELTSQAGAVRLAADEMAPTAPLLGPPTSVPGAEQMVAGQRRLQDSLLPLAGTVLDRLDAAVAARESSRNRDRLGLAAVAVVGLVAAAALLWARLPGATATGPAEEELTPVVRGPAADDSPEQARLIDARALLREVEVVRVGRAVRSAHRRPGSDE